MRTNYFPKQFNNDEWRNEVCESCGGNRAKRVWRGEHLCEECYAQRDESLKERTLAWIERYEKPSTKRARLRREQKRREAGKTPLKQTPPANAGVVCGEKRPVKTTLEQTGVLISEVERE